MEAPSSWAAFNVVLAPGLAMLFGSAFALYLRVPDKIQACTQNFSAGLLISAVAGELYPLMSPASLNSAQSTVAIATGFALGLIFMFGLEHLTEGDDDDDEERRESRTESALEQPMLDDEEAKTAAASFRATADLLKEDVNKIMKSIEGGHRDSIDAVVHDALLHVHRAERQLTQTGALSAQEIERMKFHCEELKSQGGELASATNVIEQRKALKLFSGTLEHIHEHAERKRFQRWKPAPLPVETPSGFSEKVPWPLVASVAADGGVDGLLIGLAFAASPGAGWAMSIATCIEMAFLGLSFCATISNATRGLTKRILLVSLPPFLLCLAGVIGTHVGDALHENPAVFVCFIGYSVVCLLFLVTQELLAEAREIGGDSAVINIMFFVGLLGGILLEKLVG